MVAERGQLAEGGARGGGRDGLGAPGRRQRRHARVRGRPAERTRDRGRRGRGRAAGAGRGSRACAGSDPERRDDAGNDWLRAAGCRARRQGLARHPGHPAVRPCGPGGAGRRPGRRRRRLPHQAVHRARTGRSRHGQPEAQSRAATSGRDRREVRDATAHDLRIQLPAAMADGA